MKKDKRNKSKVGKKEFQTYLKEYATRENILKTLGIVSVAGVAIYSAFKFIPFDKLVNKIDEGFNSVSQAFEENEFTTAGNVEE